MRQAELHCHCLPGIDDGPRDVAEALDLCRMIVADGTDTVVATPHMLGPYGLRNTAALVRDAVARFQQQLDDHDVPLTLLPGGEVRLDERLIKLLDDDQIITVADRGTHLLVELLEVPMMLDGLFGMLLERGVTPVIAHAELVWWLAEQPQTVERWQAAGVIIQVNAGSLLGQFGRGAHAAGWRLVGSPGPVVVASDAHNTRRRPPRLTEAYAQIHQHLGESAARRVCIDTPTALLGSSAR